MKQTFRRNFLLLVIINACFISFGRQSVTPSSCTYFASTNKVTCGNTDDSYLSGRCS